MKILNREQLCAMSSDEVWTYLTGKPPRATEEPQEREGATVSIPRPPQENSVHLFTSLLATRPACGRRLSFEPSDCTYSKPNATCPGCREAASEAA